MRSRISSTRWRTEPQLASASSTFVKHVAPTHCTEMLGLFVRDAMVWVGSLVMSAQDPYTAFGQTRHGVIKWPRIQAEVHPAAARALAAAIVDLIGSATALAAGATQCFPARRSGGTGGCESPMAWSILLVALMEPLVVSWAWANRR